MIFFACSVPCSSVVIIRATVVAQPFSDFSHDLHRNFGGLLKLFEEPTRVTVVEKMDMCYYRSDIDGAK